MTANVVATDKAGLKRALKEFGCTDGYADDIVERLKEKNDSVQVMLNKKVGSTEDKEV